MLTLCIMLILAQRLNTWVSRTCNWRTTWGKRRRNWKTSEKNKKKPGRRLAVLSVLRWLYTLQCIHVLIQRDLVISDRTTDGCSPQAEVFTVQENNGRKSSEKYVWSLFLKAEPLISTREPGNNRVAADICELWLWWMSESQWPSSLMEEADWIVLEVNRNASTKTTNSNSKRGSTTFVQQELGASRLMCPDVQMDCLTFIVRFCHCQLLQSVMQIFHVSAEKEDVRAEVPRKRRSRSEPKPKH